MEIIQNTKTCTNLPEFSSWINNNISDLKLRFVLYKQGLQYYRKYGIYLITY